MAFCINDLHAEFYSVVKYADDTSFYKTATTSQLATVVPAIMGLLGPHLNGQSIPIHH